MALRSVVSRVAQRGPAKAESEHSPLDNLRPEVPEEEVHEEQEVEVHLKDDSEPDSPEPAEQAHIEPRASRGAVREPAAKLIAEDTHQEPAPPAKKERKKREPNKKGLQVTPVAGDTDTIPQLRAKVKEVELLIKEARERHHTELSALRTVYADLHAKIFDHVK